MALNTILESPLQFLFADSREEAIVTVVTAIVITIFAPLFIAFNVFLGTGLTHLCLMMLGGANRPFEATFRVNCYAYGGSMPLVIVPFCGGFIVGIWGLVLEIIGIASVHQISTGKAVLAVLLPTIVCCGLLFGVLLAIFGVAFLQLL